MAFRRKGKKRKGKRGSSKKRKGKSIPSYSTTRGGIRL